MTTTRTAHQLIGITAGRGSCDHCGRSLARLFRLRTPEGETIVVGRTCSKNLTGWSWTVAQAEEAQRRAEREVRAAAEYPVLWPALTAQRAHETEVGCIANGVYAGFAALGLNVLRDRRACVDVVTYAEDMLARSVARFGSAS